jgi:hypothetical protein
MSLGIAIVLPSAVLLVADGRRTFPLVGNASVENDVPKILPLHEELAIIEFGVVQATEPAVEYLQRCSIVRGGVREAVDCLEHSLQYGWLSFVARLAADVDRSHPAIRAALIAGGVARGTPFIAGVLRDFSPPRSPTVSTSTYDFMVLGGEEHGSQAEFKGRATTVIQQLGSHANLFSRSLFEGMLNAAGQTIRSTELVDPRIGGMIRYMLLRSGTLPEQGVWSG